MATALAKRSSPSKAVPYHNAIAMQQIGCGDRLSEAFIAVGDTVIEAYDRVAVFALPEVIKEVDRFFR